MNYTRGEWKHKEDGVIMVGDYQVACVMTKDRQANANLISAAPDMYEALNNIRHIVDKLVFDGCIPQNHPDIVNISMASNEALWAINKADGLIK